MNATRFNKDGWWDQMNATRFTKDELEMDDAGPPPLPPSTKQTTLLSSFKVTSPVFRTDEEQVSSKRKQNQNKPSEDAMVDATEPKSEKRKVGFAENDVHFKPQRESRHAASDDEDEHPVKRPRQQPHKRADEDNGLKKSKASRQSEDEEEDTKQSSEPANVSQQGRSGPKVAHELKRKNDAKLEEEEDTRPQVFAKSGGSDSDEGPLAKRPRSSATTNKKKKKNASDSDDDSVPTAKGRLPPAKDDPHSEDEEPKRRKSNNRDSDSDETVNKRASAKRKGASHEPESHNARSKTKRADSDEDEAAHKRTNRRKPAASDFAEPRAAARKQRTPAADNSEVEDDKSEQTKKNDGNDLDDAEPAPVAARDQSSEQHAKPRQKVKQSAAKTQKHATQETTSKRQQQPHTSVFQSDQAQRLESLIGLKKQLAEELKDAKRNSIECDQICLILRQYLDQIESRAKSADQTVA